MVICLNRRESQPNPLHLICVSVPWSDHKASSFADSHVPHGLRVFQRAAVSKIGGDPGRPKTVVADRRHDAGGFGSPPHHAPGVRLIHRFLDSTSRDVPSPCGTASPSCRRRCCRRDISVKRLGRGVMTGMACCLPPSRAGAAPTPRRAAGDPRPSLSVQRDARKAIVRVAISARSRKSRTVSVGCCRSAAAIRRPPAPASCRLDDVLGRGQRGRLFGITWPTTSQSNSMRMAASCCFTLGATRWLAMPRCRRPRRTAVSASTSGRAPRTTPENFRTRVHRRGACSHCGYWR